MFSTSLFTSCRYIFCFTASLLHLLLSTFNYTASHLQLLCMNCMNFKKSFCKQAHNNLQCLSSCFSVCTPAFTQAHAVYFRIYTFLICIGNVERSWRANATHFDMHTLHGESIAFMYDELKLCAILMSL